MDDNEIIAYLFFGSLAVFSIVYFIICFIRIIIKQNKEKKAMAEEKARIGYLEYGKFLHCTGLPIATEVMCDVVYFKDHLAVRGSGLIFNLPFDRVYDMAVKTDVEIQKQYVSDAGGAVAGGMAFGAIGALLGGIVQERKSKTITSYFTITYDKDGQVTLLAFYVTTTEETAKKMVALFNQRPKKQSRAINL